MAKIERSHPTYKQELEHACCPLAPPVWVGVVLERQAEWREGHIPWRYTPFSEDICYDIVHEPFCCFSNICREPVFDGDTLKRQSATSRAPVYVHMTK